MHPINQSLTAIPRPQTSTYPPRSDDILLQSYIHILSQLILATSQALDLPELLHLPWVPSSIVSLLWSLVQHPL